MRKENLYQKEVLHGNQVSKMICNIIFQSIWQYSSEGNDNFLPRILHQLFGKCWCILIGNKNNVFSSILNIKITHEMRSVNMKENKILLSVRNPMHFPRWNTFAYICAGDSYGSVILSVSLKCYLFLHLLLFCFSSSFLFPLLLVSCS
jgi:hypothetical protein